MGEAGRQKMTLLINALVVDDDEAESGAIVDLLNSSDRLDAQAMRPLQQLEETGKEILNRLPEGAPRVLLLDYRLEDNVASGEAVTYRGGTVAGYLRDRDPELPIVLLTSEQKLHDWVESRPRVKQVFDWTLLKEELSSQERASVNAAKLAEFAEAWDGARGWPDDSTEVWVRLADLMRAPDITTMQPFVEFEAEPPRGDVTGEVMNWLLNHALRTPGPLRNGASTRVTLGLADGAFNEDSLQEWLGPATYRGALSSFHRRWWIHLVREQLAELCEGNRPLDATARAEALSSHLGTTFEPEKCNWCNGERTIDSCAVCGRASDAAHCLRPLGPPLPAWADPWIVCYRCIAEGKADAADIRFTPQALDVIDGLIEGRIAPPENE
jgi:hypothetical protein